MTENTDSVSVKSHNDNCNNSINTNSFNDKTIQNFFKVKSRDNNEKSESIAQISKLALDSINACYFILIYVKKFYLRFMIIVYVIFSYNLLESLVKCF